MTAAPAPHALTAESLSGVELFQGLDAAERRAVAARCRARRYAAGQQIVSHLDDTHDVYFIVSGSVRVTLYSPAGKEVTFRDQGAGQMFGELAAIDGEPRSAHVVALGESVVASMPPEAFREILHTHAEIADATLHRLAKLVRLLSERVFEFSTLAVRNRIHAELLRLAREHARPDGSARISPAPTHADIASRVSTHREAVTRELGELATEGVVARDGHVLVVRDVAKLERMVAEVVGR